jgi:SAM-dependent methyltransferase
VAGRRRVLALVARWMSPLDGLRVADLGCESGLATRYLDARGAKVVGVDLRMRGSWIGEPGSRYVVADLLLPVVQGECFDVVLVQEVVEGGSDSERRELLAALAGWGAKRLVLVARCPTGWSRFRSHTAVVDPVELLRMVHLQTPYRLVRQEEVRQRNYRGLVAEFHHGPR